MITKINIKTFKEILTSMKTEHLVQIKLMHMQSNNYLGTSPQNFLTFSFNLFPLWCKISISHLVPVPNYWTWTRTTPQKKWFFWSNPYKFEIVITSLIEMQVLPNFGHMATSTIWFESHDKILLVTSWTWIMTSKKFFQNIFILRRQSFLLTSPKFQLFLLKQFL